MLTGTSACDVHPYVSRIGKEGNPVCSAYASLAWMVDPFHIKGHTVLKRFCYLIYQTQMHTLNYKEFIRIMCRNENHVYLDFFIV